MRGDLTDCPDRSNSIDLTDEFEILMSPITCRCQECHWISPFSMFTRHMSSLESGTNVSVAVEDDEVARLCADEDLCPVWGEPRGCVVGRLPESLYRRLFALLALAAVVGSLRGRGALGRRGRVDLLRLELVQVVLARTGWAKVYEDRLLC